MQIPVDRLIGSNNVLKSLLYCSPSSFLWLLSHDDFKLPDFATNYLCGVGCLRFSGESFVSPESGTTPSNCLLFS